MNYESCLEQFGLEKNKFGEVYVRNKELLPRISYVRKDDAVEIRYPIATLKSVYVDRISKSQVGLDKVLRFDYSDLYFFVKFRNKDALLKILSVRSSGSGGRGVEVFNENDWYVGENMLYNNMVDLVNFTCKVFNLNLTMLKQIKRKHWNGSRVQVLDVKKFALGGEGLRTLGDGTIIRVGRGGGKPGSRKVIEDSEKVEEIWNDLVFDAFYGLADFENQYKLWCKYTGRKFSEKSCWEMLEKIRKEKAKGKLLKK